MSTNEELNASAKAYVHLLEIIEAFLENTDHLPDLPRDNLRCLLLVTHMMGRVGPAQRMVIRRTFYEFYQLVSDIALAHEKESLQ